MPHSEKRPSQDTCTAIIVADLVAELPVPSPRSSMRSNKSVKSETDRAHEDQPPNGAASEISRGVILNALQSGQVDDRAGKPIPLASVFVVAEQPKDKVEESKSGDWADMPLGRRVAFVSSFLPSIMFVLCFAVILPCRPDEPFAPCVSELWTRVWNDTEMITSTFLASPSLMVAGSRGTSHFVASFNESGGDLVWESSDMHSRINFMDCSYSDQGGKESCLLQDDEGHLRLLNISNGEQLQNWTIEGDPCRSLPTVPSHTRSNSPVSVVSGLELMYQAEKIKGLYKKVPSRMLLWRTLNNTSLLIICSNPPNEQLLLLSEERWITYERKPKGKPVLLNTTTGPISDIAPTEEGLFVWSSNVVHKFDQNATLIWGSPSPQHFKTRQFLIYGHFNGKEDQIALLSSNSSGYLQISILNGNDGKEKWTSEVIPNAHLVDVRVVKGKEKDFAIVLLRKETSSGDSVSQKEEDNWELLLMELDSLGSRHSLHSWKHPKGENFKSTFRAVADDIEKDMKLFVLQSSRSEKSVLIALSVANWDITVAKSDCNIPS